MSARTKDRAVRAAIADSAQDVLAYLQRRAGLDSAEDLLGDVLVVVWRRRGDLPADPERARMWLFGIARGVLLNHVRGLRRQCALVVRAVSSADARTAPGPDVGSEVRDALDRIDADLAELVRLVHWEKMTLVEAAELLAIPASTARTRYARAKELLRAALSVDATA